MEQLTQFAPQGAATAASQFFAKTQTTGDLDLTTAVREVLVRGGANANKLASYDSNPQIVNSTGRAPDVQLFLQKEFWTYQLLALQENQNVDTKEDRLLLQQFNEPKSWLQFFASNIADLVLVYEMPYRHGW